jgi:hypothetical protein
VVPSQVTDFVPTVQVVVPEQLLNSVGAEQATSHPV